MNTGNRGFSLLEVMIATAICGIMCVGTISLMVSIDNNNRRIYETYDRIFGCGGHGWANIQSTHLNLAFGDDAGFDRLHTAIRLVLPILGALAASSPVVAGKLSGALDTRLTYYGGNQKRVPSISGRVIPEAARSPRQYRAEILETMYRDMAELDPEGVIRHEWLNSRGAIARFDRGSIEIRLIDLQECPTADLAIVALLVAVIRALVEERWSTLAGQQAWDEQRLARILDAAIADGEAAVIGDSGYAALFGLEAEGPGVRHELIEGESRLAPQSGVADGEEDGLHGTEQWQSVGQFRKPSIGLRLAGTRR